MSLFAPRPAPCTIPPHNLASLTWEAWRAKLAADMSSESPASESKGDGSPISKKEREKATVKKARVRTASSGESSTNSQNWGPPLQQQQFMVQEPVYIMTDHHPAMLHSNNENNNTQFSAPFSTDLRLPRSTNPRLPRSTDHRLPHNNDPRLSFKANPAPFYHNPQTPFNINPPPFNPNSHPQFNINSAPYYHNTAPFISQAQPHNVNPNSGRPSSLPPKSKPWNSFNKTATTPLAQLQTVKGFAVAVKNSPDGFFTQVQHLLQHNLQLQNQVHDLHQRAQSHWNDFQTCCKDMRHMRANYEKLLKVQEDKAALAWEFVARIQGGWVDDAGLQGGVERFERREREKREGGKQVGRTGDATSGVEKLSPSVKGAGSESPEGLVPMPGRSMLNSSGLSERQREKMVATDEIGSTKSLAAAFECPERLASVPVRDTLSPEKSFGFSSPVGSTATSLDPSAEIFIPRSSSPIKHHAESSNTAAAAAAAAATTTHTSSSTPPQALPLPLSTSTSIASIIPPPPLPMKIMSYTTLHAHLASLPERFKNICPASLSREFPSCRATCTLKHVCRAYNHDYQHEDENHRKGKGKGKDGCEDPKCEYAHEYRTCGEEGQGYMCSWKSVKEEVSVRRGEHLRWRVHAPSSDAPSSTAPLLTSPSATDHVATSEEWKLRKLMASLVQPHLDGRF